MKRSYELRDDSTTERRPAMNGVSEYTPKLNLASMRLAVTFRTCDRLCRLVLQPKKIL